MNETLTLWLGIHKPVGICNVLSPEHVKVVARYQKAMGCSTVESLRVVKDVFYNCSNQVSILPKKK